MSDAFDILVIEPDDSQRQLIDLLLSDPRMRIQEHTTARAALEYLRNATPDLVIVATDLPDLDGLALTSRLKRVARLADVPVIVTADPDAGSGLSRSLRLRAEESNADLLLPRPLGDKNLKERALRLMLTHGQEGKASARALRSTVLLDEALEVLADDAARGAAAAGPRAAPGAGSASGSAPTGPAAVPPPPAGGSGSRPRQHLDAEALERENHALRLENHELRATIDRLKRQLPGGRNKP
ncbi:MAG: response regulator [Trueperaceae bacterium]|nr:response regulator [Trueperaceae bacterium]